MDRSPAAPRCAALVGPYLTGKTTLLESLLSVTGALNRKGTVKEGNTVGDAAGEARARKMSVEVSAASTEFLGERWTFLDCPGSVELAQEAQNALLVSDVAVIVCEPETAKALMLAPLFKFLDDHKIPHMLFVNKMDNASYRVREVLAALQTVSSRPLVLRQVPLRATEKSGAETVTGYVDLVSERAYSYKPGQPSDLIKMPEEAARPRAGSPPRHARIPRRFRRQVAGAIARGCDPQQGRDLSAAQQGSGGRSHRPGLLRLRPIATMACAGC